MTTEIGNIRDFLESEVAILVGSCDAALKPSIARGWAARLTEDGRIQLFISKAASPSTVSNLLRNSRVSLTFSHPLNFRTVQIKGRCTDIAALAERDWDAIERYHEAFIGTVAEYGLTREAIVNIWGPEPLRLTIEPEIFFNQTPGPGAGRPL